MKRFGGLLVLLIAGWSMLPAHGQNRVETPRAAVQIDTTGGGAQTVQAGGLRRTGLQRVRQRIAQIRGQEGAGPAVVPIIVTVPAASGAASLAVPSSSGQRSREQAPPVPSSVATRADLNRMEVRILRRIETLIDELYRRQGMRAPAPDVILRREQTPGPEPSSLETPPSRTDSLRTLPAESLAVSVDPLPVASVPPPTVVEVRRAFLETGLFRAVEVNFETGSATLRPRAERSLTAIGEVLAQYPAVRVEVAGHTDATGSAALNQRLSEQRAQAVRQYLLDTFDLGPDRVVARGYGEAQPIAPNDTPSGRALNRRVEFRVLNPEAAERALELTSTDTTAANEWEEAIRRAVQEAFQQPAAPADTSRQR